MSRIGKNPILIPKGVKAEIKGNVLEVSGPLGTLVRSFSPRMSLSVEEGKLLVKRPGDTKYFKAQHGLLRALAMNMVLGVSEGFKKRLNIIGVGYRAQVQDKDLVLQLGFSHPVVFPIPEGIKINVEKNTRITVEGIDKELVGEVSAKIRAIKPPEPYKGKGIRYEGEYVKRKAGKAALTGGKGA